MMIQNSRPEALYLHVPFCRTICAYCDFCHMVYNAKMSEQWIHALQKEIASKDINPELKTIYIGGGTPTSLTAEQLDQVLSMLDPYSRHVQEYTIEINPETLDEEKTAVIASHGINRASIGFQSSDPHLLALMGRHHDMNMIKDTVDRLRAHGIDNISLDLMYSLPSQTMAQLQQSVKDALSLSPTHLSLYSLTIEENTIFNAKGYTHLDDDTEADMYEWICRYLPACGFHQYEISNFAYGDHESMHNQMYWNYRDFYGISCGASGKEGRDRYDHTRSLEKYCRDPFAVEKIPLSEQDAMFEMLMMGLRLKQGMDLHLFESTFGVPYMDIYGRKTDEQIRKGLLTMDEDHVAATDRGYEILNSILADML